MSVSLKFDSTQFQKDFRERVARSRFLPHDVSNRVAYQVLVAAQNDIRDADRKEIEELGGVAVKIFGAKGRLLKKARNVYGVTRDLLRATNIYIARLRARGIDPKKMAPGEIQKGVKKMIARRLSAVGSVANRLTPAINKLKNAVRISYLFVRYHGPVRGKQRSRADLAQPEWNASCKFEIDVDLGAKFQSAQSKERVEGILVTAVEKGINAAMKDMEDYTVSQMNTIWK